MIAFLLSIAIYLYCLSCENPKYLFAMVARHCSWKFIIRGREFLSLELFPYWNIIDFVVTTHFQWLVCGLV
jgi:hypothetical protein